MKEFRGRKKLSVFLFCFVLFCFYKKKEYTGTGKTMSAECSTKEKIHTYKNVSLRFQVVLELSSNIIFTLIVLDIVSKRLNWTSKKLPIFITKRSSWLSLFNIASHAGVFREAVDWFWIIYLENCTYLWKNPGYAPVEWNFSKWKTCPFLLF